MYVKKVKNFYLFITSKIIIWWITRYTLVCLTIISVFLINVLSVQRLKKSWMLTTKNITIFYNPRIIFSRFFLFMNQYIRFNFLRLIFRLFIHSFISCAFLWKPISGSYLCIQCISMNKYSNQMEKLIVCVMCVSACLHYIHKTKSLIPIQQAINCMCVCVCLWLGWEINRLRLSNIIIQLYMGKSMR